MKGASLSMLMILYGCDSGLAAMKRAQSCLSKAQTDLELIPGVGPRVAAMLREVGIRRVRDLRRRNPQRLYEQLCARRGQRIDRCVLYTFRCAIYFASEPNPSPERLKWWTWKDSAANRSPR